MFLYLEILKTFSYFLAHSSISFGIFIFFKPKPKNQYSTVFVKLVEIFSAHLVNHHSGLNFSFCYSKLHIFKYQLLMLFDYAFLIFLDINYHHFFPFKPWILSKYNWIKWCSRYFPFGFGASLFLFKIVKPV